MSNPSLQPKPSHLNSFGTNPSISISISNHSSIVYEREENVVLANPIFWQHLTIFLSSYDLLHLILTGSKLILVRLRESVTVFRHHPRSGRRHLWPNIISSFPHLQHIEIGHPIHTNHPTYFHGVDIRMIPSSILSIHLNFANGFLSLTQLPSCAQLCKLNLSLWHHISIIFPNLTSLRWFDDKKFCKGPETLISLFPLRLTSLHLPSNPELVPGSFNILPRTLLDLQCTTSECKNGWNDVKFPPLIERLHLSKLPHTFHFQHLPRDVKVLKLSNLRHVEGERRNWEKLPISILKLSIEDPHLHFDGDQIRSIPHGTTCLKLRVFDVDPLISLLLTPEMRKIEIFTLNDPSLSQLLNFSFKLPPSISSLPCALLGETSNWSILPRTITRVNGREILQITAAAHPFIEHLPPFISQLCLRDAPTTLPLKHITHLQVETKNRQNTENLKSILSSLPHLTKLDILDQMVDGSLIYNSMAHSIRHLSIQSCNPIIIDFSHLISLQSLNIRHGPWKTQRNVLRNAFSSTECGMSGGEVEEWDFEFWWLVFLPPSVTHLSLGEGCLQLSGDPSFIPAWPPQIKKLELKDTIPTCFWKFFPISLTYLDMPIYGSSRNPDTIAMVIHDLPMKLTSLRLQGAQERNSDFQKFIRSRPLLQSFQGSTSDLMHEDDFHPSYADSINMAIYMTQKREEEEEG
jgi:hypothetical protein